MPGQRIVVQSGLGEIDFRPGTNPVDTFVQPTAGRKLNALAEGLSALSPSLMKYSDVMHERHKDRDTKQGEQEMRRLMDEGKTYREAIDSGLIGRHQSPFFRMAASEYAGRATAMEFGTHLRTEVTKLLEGVTDPGEAQRIVAGARARYMEEAGISPDDRYAAQAFGRTSDAAINEFMHNYALDNAQRMQRAAGESFHQTVYGVVTGLYRRGVAPAEIATSVGREIENAYAAGLMSREDANRAAAAAIGQVAQELLDPAILGDPSKQQEGLFDLIRLGTGSMAGTSYAGQIRAQVQQFVARENEYRDTVALQREQRESSAALDDAITAVYSALEQDPDANIENIEKELIRRGGAEHVQALRQVREAARYQAQFDEDPSHVAELFMQVDRGLTVGRITNELGAGRISVQTFNGLRQEIQQRQDRAEARANARAQTSALTAFLRHDGREYGERMIRSYFVNEQGAYRNAEAREAAGRAVSRWNAAYMAAGSSFDNNPDAYLRFLDSQTIRLVPEGLRPSDRQKFGQQRARVGGGQHAVSETDYAVDQLGRRWGPTRANPLETRIFENDVILRIEREATELRQGRRSSFSPFVVGIAQTYRISPENLPNILQTQRQLQW